MAAIIRRGQLLRELLKQDRFERFSPVLELAWMVAYNEGLWDTCPLDSITEVLAELKARLDPALTLDSPRSEWIQSLQSIGNTYKAAKDA